MSEASDRFLLEHPEKVARNQRLPKVGTEGTLWKAQEISKKKKRPWRKGKKAEGKFSRQSVIDSITHSGTKRIL